MTTIYKEITMVERVLIEKINFISNIIEDVQRMTISNGIHYLFMAVFTQYVYETNISYHHHYCQKNYTSKYNLK